MNFSLKDAVAISTGHGSFATLSNRASKKRMIPKKNLILASALCLGIQGCATPLGGSNDESTLESADAQVQVGTVDNSQPTVVYSFDPDEEDYSEPEVTEQVESDTETKEDARRQQAKLEKERLERQKREQAQLEAAQKAEAERLVAAQLAEERRVQMALEKAANEKAAQERAAMEKAEREAREQEALAIKELEQQELEKAAKAREIAKQAELARQTELAAAAQKVESQRQLAAQQALQKKQAEQKRLAELAALEKARLAKERLEKQRLENARIEQERLSKQKLEDERLAKQKLEEERLAKVKADQARKELAELKLKQEAERAAAKAQAGLEAAKNITIAPANSAVDSDLQLDIKPTTKIIASGDRTDYTKIIGKLVSVPSGKFKMGDLTGKGRSTERPVRSVDVNSFYIMEHEVPYKAWDACVKGGGCSYSPPNDIHGRGQQPVSHVSYNDIVNQFIPWLKKETGIDFRLPSEAEWEYAARAGTQTDFSWGDQLDCNQSRYNAPGCGQAGAAAVKSYLPNEFGLYNVNGNLWEWTQDCWQKNYRGAPANQSPRSRAACARASVRGGSWFHAKGQLRTASREKAVMGQRYFNVGFRLVMDP